MFYGWRVVAGAFTGMMLANGFFSYAFTILVDPIRAEFGASLEQVMYSLTIGTVFGLIVSPITGVLIDRYSVRALMTLGSLMVAAGFYLTSIATSITFFNLSIGLTMAMAMTYTGSMAGSAAVARWFTKSLGKAMGIAAMGTSMGGIVIPALLTYWLNSDGWRGALQNISLVTLLLVTPILWFSIRSRPADVGLQPEAEAEATAATTEYKENTVSLDMSQIVRMREFWFLGLSMGLVFSSFASMLANLAPYATRLGISEADVSSMIALLAFGGLAGKLAFGMAADRINLKVGLWIAHALLGTAFVILIFEPPFALLLVASFSFGLSTGGLLPVWNAMVAKVFGVDSFGRAMGVMGPIITLNIIPAYIIVGRLFDSTGSYTAGLILFSFVIGLAAIMIVPLRLPP
ncbi:MAG: MFS transporter [Halioglobus sp.]|nr:MFS transporter [Halioglobus sp.]